MDLRVAGAWVKPQVVAVPEGGYEGHKILLHQIQAQAKSKKQRGGKKKARKK